MRNFQIFYIILFQILSPSIIFTLASHTDKTLEEKASGVEVVQATIDKIHGSNIFPDDHNFLSRLAYSESQFGQNPATYRPHFYGGIWQVTEKQYEMTKSPRNGGKLHKELMDIYRKIQTIFNIDWSATTWRDLMKPLYSGLAARILLAEFNLVQPIPQVLSRQAKFREDFKLHGAIGLPAFEFVKEIRKLEGNQTCAGKMDLLVILDESGSVGAVQFKKALDFVANLFGTYNVDPNHVRVGFLTYGQRNEYRLHFSMTSALNKDQIRRTVMSTRYKNGAGTYTNQALQYGVSLFQNGRFDGVSTYVERPGVPKIIALFTDGMSHDGVAIASANAQKAGITTFAIGIGQYQRKELEVIARGDQNHVFTLQDFDALTEFFGRLNSATCAVSQKPATETNVKDTLGEEEKRVYCYHVPVYGITIILEPLRGAVVGYYSYSYEKPSAALHDGVLTHLKTFIPSLAQGHLSTSKNIHPLYFRKNNNKCDVYIVVEGVTPQNEYEVKAEEGNQVTTTTTTTTPTYDYLDVMEH